MDPKNLTEITAKAIKTALDWIYDPVFCSNPYCDMFHHQKGKTLCDQCQNLADDF